MGGKIAVAIDLGYELDNTEFDSWQDQRAFSLLERVQTASGAHPPSYSFIIPGILSSGVHRRGREVCYFTSY
jgi:hypothetical protein